VGRGRVLFRILVVVGIVLLFAQAIHFTDFSLSALFSGLGNIWSITMRAFPPKLNVLRDSIHQSVVTFDTALLGTAIALILSLILAPLAAKSLSPHRIVYEISRVIIAITRTLPELIFALMFVTAVGLGPFAGVLALSVHSIGTLGKLFAETIEDMDRGTVEALRTAGAGRIQVFVHGVLPEVAPTFVSLSLYRLDVNIRAGSVLGIAGAGGIGFLIYNSIQLFQYREVTTELLVLLALILIVERISSILRSRIA
jgi:phosphonate transport system permease protein